jgi:tRNA(Ile)-lysidine synthase
LREARRIGAERRLYESALAGSPGACVALSLAGLRALHRAVASRVVRIAAAAVRGTAQDLHLAHAEKILALAESPAAGKRLNMPGGLEALKSYDIIIFHKIAPRPGGRMGDYVEMPPKQAPNALNTAKLIKSFRKKDFENIEEIANISYNSLVQYFDGDILDPRRCVFRGRRGGDVFFPRNAPCAKKLKDWLIDEKIPAAVRDGLTLLADGSEIAWVAGYGTSEKYRVTAGTETVLRVELANV